MQTRRVQGAIVNESNVRVVGNGNVVNGNNIRYEGNGGLVNGNNCTYIGNGGNVIGDNTTMIGNGGAIRGTKGKLTGNGGSIHGDDGVCVGNNCTVIGQRSRCLGMEEVTGLFQLNRPEPQSAASARTEHWWDDGDDDNNERNDNSSNVVLGEFQLNGFTNIFNGPVRNVITYGSRQNVPGSVTSVTVSPPKAEQRAQPVDRVVEGTAEPCVICLENVRCVALMPCSHLCLCAGCSKSIETCPMCRAHVSDKMPLFV